MTTRNNIPENRKSRNIFLKRSNNVWKETKIVSVPFISIAFKILLLIAYISCLVMSYLCIFIEFDFFLRNIALVLHVRGTFVLNQKQYFRSSCIVYSY